MTLTSLNLNEFLTAAKTQLVALAPKLIMGVVIFLLFWLIGKLCQSVIIRLAGKNSQRCELMRLLGKACKITLVIFGLISALGTVGVNISAVIAGLGLTGFAFGFALKDSISNMLAGFMILFYHPFKVGDEITVSSNTGKVSHISLRYTTLQQEGQHVLIPNASLLSNAVVVVNKVTTSESQNA